MSGSLCTSSQEMLSVWAHVDHHWCPAPASLLFSELPALARALLLCPGFHFMQSVFLPSWPPAPCSSFDVCTGKGCCSCSRFHRASRLWGHLCTWVSTLRIRSGLICVQLILCFRRHCITRSEIKTAGVCVLPAVMGGENNHMHRKIWDFNTNADWVMQCNYSKNLATRGVTSPHSLII